MTTPKFSRRSAIQSLAMSLLAADGWTLALAQTAAAPLRMLCSGPAGSIPDIVARRVADGLTRDHARASLVDNRPGAAGQLAVGALKMSPADGSTVLLAQGALATVYPYLYTKLAYDPQVDLQPVTIASEMSLALAVGPVVPGTVGHVRELAQWMRANPKLANAGSPGIGTLPHLLEAMVFQQADAPWQHVAYAGGPPAMVDLLGGQIAVLVLPEGLMRQHKATGRLRVLGTSGAQRSSYFPDVPTFVEQGFKDLVMREWFGFFMPAQTSPQVIDTTSVLLRKALEQPELVAAYAEAGMRATSSTPAAMSASIASERMVWQTILKGLDIKVE
jgi:tripartite-type tricarboxylate transporter receptor subunit TctC